MNDDGFAIEVALVAVLILLNGFFSGAEIAVISARRARIQAQAEAGNRRAQALLRLKADPDRFLATVQIGVTLVGTLASAVGGVAAVERIEPLVAAVPAPWMRDLAEPVAVGSVVFAIAFLSLVIGELVPKSLALRHAEPLALLVARPIDWLSRAGRFAVAVLNGATGLVLRLLGQKLEAHNPFHTVETTGRAGQAAEQGVLDGQVVKGAVEFPDSEARHLMTARSRVRLRNMTAVDATGLHALDTLGDRLRRSGRTMLLCGARHQPARFLQQAEFVAHIGERNFLPHVEAALARAQEIQAGFSGMGEDVALALAKVSL